MCDRYWRYSDSLHLPIRVRQLVELYCQLAGLGSAEPASVDASAYVLLDHEAEQQRQADALVVQAADVTGQEPYVFGSEGCDAGAQVVFATVFVAVAPMQCIACVCLAEAAVAATVTAIAGIAGRFFGGNVWKRSPGWR